MVTKELVRFAFAMLLSLCGREKWRSLSLGLIQCDNTQHRESDAPRIAEHRDRQLDRTPASGKFDRAFPQYILKTRHQVLVADFHTKSMLHPLLHELLDGILTHNS